MRLQHDDLDLTQVREAIALWDAHGFDWKEARNRYRHLIEAARRYVENDEDSA